MDKKGTKNKNRDIQTENYRYFLVFTECCLPSTVRATRDKQGEIFYINMTPLYVWFMPRPQLDNFFYNEAMGIIIKTYLCSTQRTPSPLSTCIHTLRHLRCSHGRLALPRTLWLRGALHIFLSFSTPEGERHTKKANHPTSSENTPMYPLKQSEHTRHASLFSRFDSHATHACTLQPAALVFVSYGFVSNSNLYKPI